MDLAQSIKEIVDCFGINAIERPGLVKLIDNYGGFEGFKPAKMLVKILLSDGYCSRLKVARGDNNTLRATIIEIRGSISDDYGIDDVKVSKVLDAFYQALCSDSSLVDAPPAAADTEAGGERHIHTDMQLTLKRYGKYVLCDGALHDILLDMSPEYRTNTRYTAILTDVLRLNYGQRIYNIIDARDFGRQMLIIKQEYANQTTLAARAEDIDYIFYCLQYAINPDGASLNDTYTETEAELTAEGYCEMAHKLDAEGDYTGALNAYLQAAQMGCVDAYMPIATAYDTGRGTTVDAHEAMKWYKALHDKRADGLSAYHIGRVYQYALKDYGEAYNWYKTSRNKGESQALFAMAYLYENALGIEKNLEEAVFLYAENFKKAKNHEAAFRLGQIYQLDYAIYKQAFKWYKIAMELGSKDAIYRIGYLYEMGKGVDKDINKAVTLFKESFDKTSDTSSAFRIGQIYQYDMLDYTQAFNWYNKAIDLGHERSLYALAYLYEKGKGVAKSTRRAIKLYKECYDKSNDSDAAYRLGWIFQNDDALADRTYAFRWYTKAKEAGNTAAIYMLGYIYEFGNGVSKDLQKAVELYKESYDKTKDRDSAYRLGQIYQYDYTDYDSAMKWYEIASDLGKTRAKYLIGFLYEYGYGVKKDLKKAVSIYKEVFDKSSDKDAAFRLGQIYHYDFKMYSDAEKWYQKAKSLGHAKAADELAKIKGK